MTLGLFDLPAPLLQWVDERLSTVLPAALSVALWAVVGGIVCLELYRVVSPQKRIREIRQETKAVQQQLAGYDGEMEEAWPMIKSMLGLSLKRVGIVIPATLLGAYPIIVLLVWLSSAYGHVFPARGEPVAVDIAAPLDTEKLTQLIDGAAPTTTLTASPLSPGSSDYQVRWSSGDDAGGSGVKHVTVYVAEDGGDFVIWQRQTTATSAVYQGRAGHTYEFLALATDNAGNRERPPAGVQAPDDGSAVMVRSEAVVWQATDEPWEGV